MDTILDISDFQKFLKDEEEIIIDEFQRKYSINFSQVEDAEAQRKDTCSAVINKPI
ncbi:hypothetical protein ACOL3F_12030 [Aliarcobacter butzleri]